MIINSILDTDLYKMTMQYAVIKLYPRLKVKYKFTDRNKISFPDGFDKKLLKEIKNMEKLKLTYLEKNYLTEKLGHFLPPTYIDFLAGYQYNSNEVEVTLDEDNKLNIWISGFWYRAILWEVPLMAIISELYFIETGQNIDVWKDDFVVNDMEKLLLMKKHNSYFADFGTRRRYSYDSQDKIINLYSSSQSYVFVGTSNVHFAFKYGVKAIGSMAHELIMTLATLYGYRMANKMIMDMWIDVYDDGLLGTMLPDTFTLDVFLRSFNFKFASLFTSIRHDSGCPFEFTDKIINHYKKLNIDPMSKTIIFSDGLDTKKAVEIKEYCVGKIKSSFGIGTNLTNDYPNIKPLNMVIKISEVLINDEWHHAVKLSDNLGKNTGNVEEVNLCKKILKIN